jgi:hypothetical protein
VVTDHREGRDSVSGKGYQDLLDCRRRGRLLREHGFTIDQIAVVISLDYPVTPLRLYRYAAGLTAAEVVAAYARLEATAGATLREARLYDYELAAGRRPSPFTLIMLARIYGARPSRLLSAEALGTYPIRDQYAIRHPNE